MAFSQSDLDALDAAIAQGALRVKYADKEVTYRSLDEMMRVRNFIEEKLGKKAAGASRIYPTTSKGLDSDVE